APPRRTRRLELPPHIHVPTPSVDVTAIDRRPTGRVTARLRLVQSAFYGRTTQAIPKTSRTSPRASAYGKTFNPRSATGIVTQSSCGSCGGERTCGAVALNEGTALIVDPDGKARTSLRKLLERAGFDSIEAANGEDALALVRANHPWLV